MALLTVIAGTSAAPAGIIAGALTASARRLRRWVGALLLLPAVCLATEVSVVAVKPGRSAEIVIGDGAPLTLEVGETVDGVHLLRADTHGAVVSVDGTTKHLPVVAHPAADAVASTGVTLNADAHGQFFTGGAVNGRPVRFVVDTGATFTALSRTVAQRIGLDYRGGRPTKSMTANGVVNGWLVTLGSVRVGNLTEHGVEAVVFDNDALAVVLLGTNFLTRFDMHRQGSTLVLRRRR